MLRDGQDARKAQCGITAKFGIEQVGGNDLRFPDSEADIRKGAFAEGMGIDGSSIEGFTRIEESDMVAIPDASTFQMIPWKTEGEMARMFCDIYQPDGTPFDGDPRYVLKRQLKRAADLGFTFYVGPELEYFYLKSIDDPTPLDQSGYFDETPLDLATDWRKRTVTYLEAMGIPVEYVHHEVAPSQHEIDLRYTDALSMADNVMTYRLLVKEVAQEFGIYATFMPKPFAGVNGSGMHTHQSLFKGDRNAFFDAKDEAHLSTLGRHYIAGLFGEDGLALLDLWVPQPQVRRILAGYGRGQEPLPVYKMPHLRGWAVAGRKAYLPAIGRHEVLVVDTATWQEVGRIPVAGQPVFVMARPDGRQVWVNFAVPDYNRVQVIDTPSQRVVATLEPGAAVLHLEFTPRGEAVWISSRDANRVSVVDTRSLQTVAALDIDAPSGIFFTSRAARMGF